MLVPVAFLAGFMTIITAPGLVAQYLEARKAKRANIEVQNS